MKKRFLLLALLAPTTCFLAGCATPAPDMPPAAIHPAPPPESRPPPPFTRPQPVVRPQPPPPSGPALPQATNAWEDVVALQTMLDRANLSPGMIDGRMGPRTREALAAWQARNGLAASGEMDGETLAGIGVREGYLTTHAVTADEHALLTAVPTTWRGRAQAQRLGYATILETVAEQYHAAENTLRRLNPDAAWPNPPPGTLLTVPDPRPCRKMPVATLHISLGRKTLTAYSGDNELVALFPCSIGRDPARRPTGELQVVNCAANPNYYFDPSVFPEDEEAQTITGKLVIPSGPNNPVGVAWISLDRPGYGIHGTPHPEDIGKTESHGCFRLANWNAGKLLQSISIGTPVIVEE